MFKYPPAFHDLNDPHFGYFLWVSPFYAVVVETNIPTTYSAHLSFEQTRNSFQSCTFSSAIGSQQRYDFPVTYLERCTPQH
jgi:hypothetical protein